MSVNTLRPLFLFLMSLGYLTSHAKTNVRVGLPARVPACGGELKISFNPLTFTQWYFRGSGKALVPRQQGKVECETGFPDFPLQGWTADWWVLHYNNSHKEYPLYTKFKGLQNLQVCKLMSSVSVYTDLHLGLHISFRQLWWMYDMFAFVCVIMHDFVWTAFTVKECFSSCIWTCTVFC